jgi:hypothetical protein
VGEDVAFRGAAGVYAACERQRQTVQPSERPWSACNGLPERSKDVSTLPKAAVGLTNKERVGGLRWAALLRFSVNRRRFRMIRKEGAELGYSQQAER